MEFEELYKQLNKEQKEAVDAIDGPVMVMAGPGTGKTQILGLRIANILKKTDTDADSILALTFTDSGVFSMKRRLISIIGNEAYRVNINTFHGFCNDLIQNYPEYFSNIIGFNNIEEIKQIQVFQKILDSLDLNSLVSVNNKYYFLNDIKKRIEDLKKEGVDFKELRDLANEAKESLLNDSENMNPKTGELKIKAKDELKRIEKNIELSFIYEEYQKELKNLKLYDYTDMIVEVLNVLRSDKDFLLELQIKYQYFLVDEYQDTNSSQNQILELLCNHFDNPNIFIVGDPKQAIFRFQGASIRNFDYFKKLYPKAVLINLVNNYRSSQLILDSAFSVIKRDSELKSCGLYTCEKIKVCTLANPINEAYFISKKVQELITSGIEKKEIAVLYRNHRDVDETMRMLDKFNVSYNVKKKINIFDDPDISKLILLLRTIYNYGSDEYLFKALHIDFLNIDPLDVYRTIYHCNSNKIGGYAFLDSKIDLELNSMSNILIFKDNLKKWNTLANNEVFLNFFDEIIHDIGFYEYILKNKNVVDKLDKIDSLFDLIKKLSQSNRNFFLADFIDYLDIMLKNNVDISRDTVLGDVSGVKLMTAHGAKGLEFEYVFIIGCNSSNWEDKKNRNTLPLILNTFKKEEDDDSEERNLFYVCLTRAKKQIFITNYESSLDGKSMLLSSFVNEIKDDYKTCENIDLTLELKNLRVNSIRSKEKKAGVKDKELIKEIFVKNGLSVTAFNNYLSCPWKYFYRNLFRIPEIQNTSLIKGNAVHGALKDFFNMYKEGRPKKEYLLDRYEFYLNSSLLSLNDFEILLKNGRKFLSSYYDYYPEFNSNTLTEFAISGIKIDEDIVLTGKLDKIELFDNSHVNVVDYKTGKVKSENEVLGKTKANDENYLNQIKFYALLLKYYMKGKYIMDKGIIDFIEPRESGEHARYSIVVEDEDIDALEVEVKRVGHEILNLDFWDRECEDKECEYCKLRRIMGE